MKKLMVLGVAVLFVVGFMTACERVKPAEEATAPAAEQQMAEPAPAPAQEAAPSAPAADDTGSTEGGEQQ